MLTANDYLERDQQTAIRYIAHTIGPKTIRNLIPTEQDRQDFLTQAGYAVVLVEKIQDTVCLGFEAV